MLYMSLNNRSICNATRNKSTFGLKHDEWFQRVADEINKRKRQHKFVFGLQSRGGGGEDVPCVLG